MATMTTRQDPMRADAIRTRAGWALRASAAPKKIARAVGRSTRLAQDWCSGARPSAASQCAEMLVAMAGAGLDPWPVITFLRVEVMTEMASVDVDELTARMRAAMVEETAAQGDLDMLQMRYGAGAADDPAFLEELEQRAMAHARRCEEIATYARLKRRAAEGRAS